MTGTAFFNPGDGKCPNCGDFAVEVEEDDREFQRCPGCETRFNEYVILQQGADHELQNN